MSMSRREVLQSSGALGAAALGAQLVQGAEKPLKGNINHSVVFWCFNIAGEKWDIERTCANAKALGCKSVEICGPETWPTLKKFGLTCAIAPNGMPGAPFMKGLNNVKYHDQVIASTRKMIDECAKASVPAVIAFTGYKYVDADDSKSAVISRDDGEKNCVAGLKKLAMHAEKQKVTVCLEHLNTRDDSHPMKGHPGYQGDDLDYCAAIVRQAGSPRVKLLFDIYHVAIMNGDIIRRLRQYRDILGHIHAAGVPGRGELDECQEINYPAVVRTLVDIGDTGSVGQELIPTRDPIRGLTQAVELCDV